MLRGFRGIAFWSCHLKSETVFDDLSRFRFIFIANQNERDGHAIENETEKRRYKKREISMQSAETK